MCINMAIAEVHESIEGLRPHKEIFNIVKHSIEVKELYPHAYYD